MSLRSSWLHSETLSQKTKTNQTVTVPKSLSTPSESRFNIFMSISQDHVPSDLQLQDCLLPLMPVPPVLAKRASGFHLSIWGMLPPKALTLSH